MWLLSLWIFSTGAIVSSLLVITSVKAINAIISLIVAFINAIGIFMLLGVDFIALIYCIVYVGAIAILFLFVIMLLSENGELADTNITQKINAVNNNKGYSSAHTSGNSFGIAENTTLEAFASNPIPVKSLKNTWPSLTLKTSFFKKSGLNKNILLNNRPMVILIGVLYIVEVWCGIVAGSWNRGIIDVYGNNNEWSLNTNNVNVISLLHNKNCITSLGEMLYSECGYEVLTAISLILLVGMIGSIVLTLRPNTRYQIL